MMFLQIFFVIIHPVSPLSKNPYIYLNKYLNIQISHPPAAFQEPQVTDQM